MVREFRVYNKGQLLMEGASPLDISNLTPHTTYNLEIATWDGKLESERVPVPQFTTLREQLVQGFVSPYRSTDYLVGTWASKKPLKAGDVYMVEVEGTKPFAQNFGFYLGTNLVGYFVPKNAGGNKYTMVFTNTVEGANEFKIYQYPSGTAGQVELTSFNVYKIDVSENLLTEESLQQFPINVNTYNVFTGTLKKKWELGKRYYVRLKGTKLESQNFTVYSDAGKTNKGNMSKLAINHNLLPNITSKAFTLGTGATVKDGTEGEVILTLDGTNQLLKYDTTFKLPQLTEGKTYTLSADIKFHSDIVGDVRHLRLSYNYLPGGAVMLETTRPITDVTKDKWIKIKGTNTIKYDTNPPSNWYLVIQDFIASNRVSGTISLRNIQVVEGTLPKPDTYELTFPISQWDIDREVDNTVAIYQTPTEAGVGQATIEELVVLETNEAVLPKSIEIIPSTINLKVGESSTSQFKVTPSNAENFLTYFIGWQGGIATNSTADPERGLTARGVAVGNFTATVRSSVDPSVETQVTVNVTA